VSLSFPAGLIGLVLCPRDFGTLTFCDPPGATQVATGAAQCERCGVRYEIVQGILRLLPSQKPLDSATRDEQKVRDQKADRYDSHFSEVANRAELSAILAESSLLPNGTILDLACGTGRVTVRLLQRGQKVLAADLSEESLRVLSQKIGFNTNVGLIWSNATQLRIAPETVDLAVSTQLFEHIPTIAQRAEFLEWVHAALKPKGIFLLTAYYYSSLRRFLRKQQEGFHDGGIFYRRFTRAEIESEMSGFFRIAKLRPIQIDPRLLPSSLPETSWLAAALEKTFLRELVGQLLFVKASKEPAASMTN
jgi:ubiquinone/menaquinone biosynthesis C-methylase UbiE